MGLPDTSQAHAHPTLARGQALARATVGTLLSGTVWLLGFPWFLDALFVPLAWLAAWRVPLPRLLLMLLSSWLGLGLGETAWRILAHWGQPSSPYYRPEDQYARRDGYEPGIDVLFKMPHGDLVPMEPALRGRIAEPRSVRFVTDSVGYRNDVAFDNQQILLVGDSFVLGSGLSQEFLLANVLEREWGLRAYSIGLPKSPDWLLQRADEFLKNASADAVTRVVLFVFEGNDFSPTSGLRDRDGGLVPPPYDRIKLQWIHRLGFHTGNRLFNVTRQGLNRRRLPEEGYVEVRSLAGKEVGFLGRYIDMSLAGDPRFQLPPNVQAFAGRLAGVVFIPTKYRVYFEWAEQRRDRVLPEPAPALLELRRHFLPMGVPVIDLTPSLRQAAATALARGEFVYGRDDSHWNPNGVTAAAAVVADFLKSASSTPSTGTAVSVGEQRP